MRLRIFTEPQLGADYPTLLRVATATEELGFDAFFRSDHFLTMGDSPGLPGPTDSWVTLAGLALRDQPYPARHAGHCGHLPAARAAGDLGGAGGPDERRPGRVRLRHRVVRGRAHRVRDTVPQPGGAVRPVRGAARDHHRAVGDAARGRPSPTTAATTSWRTRPRCPSPRSGRGRRSFSAAPGRAAPRAWRRGTRTSSTWRSHVPERRRRRSAGSEGGLREARPGAGVDHHVRGADRVLRQGRRRGRPARRGDRAGGRTSCAPTGLAGTPAEVVDKIGALRRAGAGTIYLQVLDLSDLDHLELIASEVLRQVPASALTGRVLGAGCPKLCP